MELRQYLRIIRKRWWLVLLIAILGTAGAYYFISQRPPQYRSSATLLLSPALTKEALSAEVTARTYSLAQTYALYLKTTAFGELVVEGEELPISVNQFVNSVDARLVEGTLFFEITAVAQTPELAQRITQGAADYFVQEIVSQQQEQERLRQQAITVDTSTGLLQEKLERERAYYEGEVARLRDQLAQLDGASGDIGVVTTLQEELSEKETKLLQVMSDQALLSQPRSDSSQANAVTIVEAATLPVSPRNGSYLNELLAALMASVGLGLALAFGLEYLDLTIKTPDELEELYGEPTLGVLTRLPKRPSSDKGLVVLEDAHSAVAEAFRVLRTNIQFSSVDRSLRSLVVTSAAPGEGKTFTASNLAVAMAQAGKRIILVDSDLRRPMVHKRFDLPNKRGFTSLLIEDNSTEEATIQLYLQDGPVDGLKILTSGPVPPNPSELLSVSRTQEVLRAVETMADLVIYDTPPAASVADAAIIASRADGTLQVVASSQTRQDHVLKARDVLRRVEANILGPVLNRVDPDNLGYYYYYYNSTYTSTSGRHGSDNIHAPPGAPSSVVKG